MSSNSEMEQMPVRVTHQSVMVVVCMAMAIGCTNRPAPTSVTGQPADRSLDLQEFIEAGVPAPDLPWSGDDMADVADVLAGISQNDLRALPRYDSQRSGKVFQRLTADENLELYRDASLPIQQRLNGALDYLEAGNQVLKIYLRAFEQRGVSGSELVELYGSQLRTIAVLMPIVDEFVLTLDKEDPTYATRMDGLKRMRIGMATVIAGNLQTLSESHAYRTSELKRLVRYLEETLPIILPALPEDSRDETLVRLRAFSRAPDMQHLTPEINRLLAAVDTSSKLNLAR